MAGEGLDPREFVFHAHTCTEPTWGFEDSPEHRIRDKVIWHHIDHSHPRIVDGNWIEHVEVQKIDVIKQLYESLNAFDEEGNTIPLNEDALENLKVFLEVQLGRKSDLPERVIPMITADDEGIGVYWKNDRRSLYVEFFNNGSIAFSGELYGQYTKKGILMNSSTEDPGIKEMIWG